MWLASCQAKDLVITCPQKDRVTHYLIKPKKKCDIIDIGRAPGPLVTFLLYLRLLLFPSTHFLFCSFNSPSPSFLFFPLLCNVYVYICACTPYQKSSQQLQLQGSTVRFGQYMQRRQVMDPAIVTLQASEQQPIVTYEVSLALNER